MDVGVNLKVRMLTEEWAVGIELPNFEGKGETLQKVEGL